MSNTKIARAADVGFGFTKITQSMMQPGGDAKTMAFPSYADFHVEGIAGGFGKTQDILSVEVNGAVYSVGPDSKKVASGYGKQLLEREFFRSPQYQALNLGAIAMMDCEYDIHMLCVGLHLNVFGDSSLREDLKSYLTSEHIVPDLNNGGKKKVKVHAVEVVPQIIGSVITLAESLDGLGEEVYEQRNLTIDVGYGTFLWMVSNGMASVAARSGSTMGGVASILQSIIKSMDASASSDVGILDRLDHAILNNLESIKINGKKYRISDHVASVEGLTQQNITMMMRSIGQVRDIDNIFLCGGGSSFYLDALKKALGDREIAHDPNGSQFSNVKGFQLIAENMLDDLV